MSQNSFINRPAEMHTRRRQAQAATRSVALRYPSEGHSFERAAVPMEDAGKHVAFLLICISTVALVTIFI